MTPKEQEIAIKELEERVDRLRNIYEQYFLGFERLEPTVPRKDVERRFALLRKEQIRNTAMRFRFNVITQKYNTYAIHWVRICRQIEEGTYKRHVRRAAARFGDGAGAGAKPEREVSSIDIDIDTADFDVDMGEALAEEADAGETYELSGSDTLPPPAPERAPSARTPTANSSRASVASSRHQPLDDLERAAPPSMNVASDRAGRQVALPAGAKPRVVLRKRDDGDQAPARAAPSATTRAASSSPSPSGGGIPASAQTAGAQASGRIPVAPPASGQTPASGRNAIGAPPGPSAPSAGRQAVAPPGAPAGPQIRPLGSGGRMPASAGSAARVPAASSPGATSAGRMPVAPIVGPPMPPPSSPKLPIPPSTRLPASSPKVLPPAPRAPLPLPSEAARPTKK